MKKKNLVVGTMLLVLVCSAIALGKMFSDRRTDINKQQIVNGIVPSVIVNTGEEPIPISGAVSVSGGTVSLASNTVSLAPGTTVTTEQTLPFEKGKTYKLRTSPPLVCVVAEVKGSWIKCQQENKWVNTALVPDAVLAP